MNAAQIARDAARKHAFRTVPTLPALEVNRNGDIRESATGKPCKIFTKQHTKNSVSYFVVVRVDGKPKHKTIGRALFETFGAGAATEAGYKEPSRYQYETAPAESYKKISKRKCTTCGKPTSNWRCQSCWDKIRGKE
ncbi:MAG: hypothetical protein ACNI27_07250 [Desulfovibrio sp.]